MSQPIDADAIRHIARLSRIEMDEERLPPFLEQFTSILAYFDKLNELPTDNEKPLTHAVEAQNVMADDTPGRCLATDQALDQAPDREGDFFRVPKILGDS
jgi:aspartyl-tRNA(Asn)/glutamyl-tRNA(Gln) amidotransferase subunit C